MIPINPDKLHKIYICCILFLILVIGICLYYSTQKSNEAEITKIRLEYKEQERLQIVKERDSILKKYNSHDSVINRLISIDSSLMRQQSDLNYQNILLTNQNKANEKKTAIGNYGSRELYMYFTNIK